ncbi:hypothetical protein Tco_0976985 [Tanacetum coccineum]|uniref:Ubiquitin-like protease family profile domain-containing protein n=1 Tax=Tanacetum coccineum TaxID=301880 RepID=A0ABQ5EJ95_9ASTR
MPLGDHSSHWVILLGEIVREFLDALWFLAQHLGGTGGEGPQKDWGLSKRRICPPNNTTYSVKTIRSTAIQKTHARLGHIPSVGRVLTGRGKDIVDVLAARCNHTSDVDEIKRTNKQLKKHMDMIMKVVRSDDKMSQLLTQLLSQNDVGSGSGSSAGGDDESGDDEDANEDEEDEDC